MISDYASSRLLLNSREARERCCVAAADCCKATAAAVDLGHSSGDACAEWPRWMRQLWLHLERETGSGGEDGGGCPCDRPLSQGLRGSAVECLPAASVSLSCLEEEAEEKTWRRDQFLLLEHCSSGCSRSV